MGQSVTGHDGIGNKYLKLRGWGQRNWEVYLSLCSSLQHIIQCLVHLSKNPSVFNTCTLNSALTNWLRSSHYTAVYSE